MSKIFLKITIFFALGKILHTFHQFKRNIFRWQYSYSFFEIFTMTILIALRKKVDVILMQKQTVIPKKWKHKRGGRVNR